MRRGIVGINADNGPRDCCAFGAPGASAPVGVKRSAAFGTSVASWMLVVTISAVAVMPGRNSESELSTSSTVSYVTTPVEVALLPEPPLLLLPLLLFCVLFEAKSTRVIFAWNWRFGNASTV